MKSQFKKADASGARYALIFGADELAAGHGGREAVARRGFGRARADCCCPGRGQSLGTRCATPHLVPLRQV
jgi:histidyl-tRNA synthetase